ncbi:hypothetical protein AZE42_08813 [Rhizopogon vesiculosus]|uniref:Uncharacterized protein n=1 Tax=Rhizopogon vesiculosus TaxID=180088 RepID=A0A1J8Q6U2_9AGAM|nr:hypothetical protein AZE42_08813 [Rhizopogon vesiculosus]
MASTSTRPALAAKEMILTPAASK